MAKIDLSAINRDEFSVAERDGRYLITPLMRPRHDTGAAGRERDALREVLEMVVKMVETDGFVWEYAMDVARAALGQGRDQP